MKWHPKEVKKWECGEGGRRTLRVTLPVPPGRYPFLPDLWDRHLSSRPPSSLPLQGRRLQKLTEKYSGEMYAIWSDVRHDTRTIQRLLHVCEVEVRVKFEVKFAVCRRITCKLHPELVHSQLTEGRGKQSMLALFTLLFWLGLTWFSSPNSPVTTP